MERSKHANAIDMIGLRYGRMFVLSRAERKTSDHQAKWICLCDCGTVKSVAGTNLRKCKTQSCGCYQRDMARIRAAAVLLHRGRPRQKMSGARIGRYIVIIFAGYNRHNQSLWLAQRDTGELKIIDSNQICKWKKT